MHLGSFFFFFQWHLITLKNELWASSGSEVPSKTMKYWRFENEAATISSALSPLLARQESGYENQHHWIKKAVFGFSLKLSYKYQQAEFSCLSTTRQKNQSKIKESRVVGSVVRFLVCSILPLSFLLFTKKIEQNVGCHINQVIFKLGRDS